MSRTTSRGQVLEWGLWAVAVAAGAGLVVAARPAPAHRVAGTEPPTVVASARPTENLSEVSSAGPTRAVQTKRIEAIRVGDRVLGHNPDRDEGVADESPDPATWGELEVELQKPDGRLLSVTLLRPAWWIDLHVDVPAGTAFVVVPELGVVGEGRVLATRRCSPISDGPGAVVTGTFRHEVAGPLVRVTANGDEFTCTPNHPVWSATRRAFVRADQLALGEALETRLNGAVRVDGVAAIQAAETTVYNLEVGVEHVYEVGATGALVHNKCAGYHHFWPHAWGNLIPYGHKTLTFLTAAEHTNIHRAFSDFLFNKTGKYFNSMSGAEWVKQNGRHKLNQYLHEFHRQFSSSAEGQAIQARIGRSVYDMFKAEYRYAVRRGFLQLP